MTKIHMYHIQKGDTKGIQCDIQITGKKDEVYSEIQNLVRKLLKAEKDLQIPVFNALVNEFTVEEIAEKVAQAKQREVNAHELADELLDLLKYLKANMAKDKWSDNENDKDVIKVDFTNKDGKGGKK